MIEGFWYYLGKLYDVTNDRHVNMIIDHPEMFDLTKEYIKDVFQRHGEKLRVEGKAREELIISAIKNGWIRVRHYVGKQDYWSIQYNNFAQQKRSLHDLVEHFVLDLGIMTKDAEVVFLGFGDNTRYVYSFMEGGILKFMQERTLTKFSIQLVEDFKFMKESSLSRILQHIKNGKTFGVVSAFLVKKKRPENIQRHIELKQDIQNLGLGYIEQNAGYTYEDEDTGETETADEISFFIPNIDKKTILMLGKKYLQKAVLFKDENVFQSIKTTEKEFGQIDMNFSKEKGFTYDPEILQYAFSALIRANGNQRGVKFAYLGEKVYPTIYDGYKAQKTGKLPKTKWVEVILK